MVVVDGQGIPLGNHLDSASPSEVTLLEKTIDNISVPRKGRGRPRKKPRRIIADKAYDSDPHRRRLRRRGIELICPYRKNSQKQKYHDGRKLRRWEIIADCWSVGNAILSCIGRSFILPACL